MANQTETEGKVDGKIKGLNKRLNDLEERVTELERVTLKDQRML